MGISDHFKNITLPSHSSITPNNTYSRTFGEISRGIKESDDISYVYNNYGHRCDDFKQEHNEQHILFAGCSITLGEGLPYMSNWSGRLYNKLSLEIKTSGYFNLSFLGGSSELIISNIYKYIINYGAPDMLFLHLPETSRFISYGKQYDNATEKDNESIKKRNRWYVYNMMIGLELFCQYADIKLLWTSWDKQDSSFYNETGSFNNFILLNDVDIYLSSKNKHEKSNNYYGIARDIAHPGLMYSDGLANIYYDEVMK